MTEPCCGSIIAEAVSPEVTQRLPHMAGSPAVRRAGLAVVDPAAVTAVNDVSTLLVMVIRLDSAFSETVLGSFVLK